MSKLYIDHLTAKVEYNGRWHIVSLKDNEGSVIIKVEHPKEFKHCTKDERKCHVLITRTIKTDIRLSYNFIEHLQDDVMDVINQVETIITNNNL